MAYSRVLSRGLRSALAQSYCSYSSSPMIIVSPLTRNKHVQLLRSSTCTHHFCSGSSPSEVTASVKPKHGVQEAVQAVEKEVVQLKSRCKEIETLLQEKAMHMEKRQQTILENFPKLQEKNPSTNHHLGTHIMKILNGKDTATFIVGLGLLMLTGVALAGGARLLFMIFSL